MKKKIAILGSTGSIGTQALDVVKQHPELFEVSLLSANSNISLLIRQAREFKPKTVVIADEKNYYKAFKALKDFNIEVLAGEKHIAQSMEMDTFEIVLIALVGYSGLLPTITAIKNHKNIALANKETLVIAGEMITNLAKEYEVQILPVDSEHSAVFQCLLGEKSDDVEKLILTASGGPFRGKSKDELVNVNKSAALNHPNWNMGDKITIDSASLMNKGLEVIEARWLFDIDPKRIQVIIHPQSIIHSIVQFIDSSMKAQMGLPDMRIPILYALSYPNRILSDFPRFDFMDYPELTFELPDTKIFRNLALAYNALERGGNMPCILNAANEVAVNAFLNSRIKFLQMSDIIEKCMQNIEYIENPGFEDFVETNKETIIKAENYI